MPIFTDQTFDQIFDQTFRQFWGSDQNSQEIFRLRLQQVAQDGKVEAVLQESALLRSAITGSIKKQITLWSKDELIEIQACLNKELDDQLAAVINELVQTQMASLTQQAHCDPVTGLRNRLAFNLDLQNEIIRARRYARSFSLVLFDVDNFKSINDRFGHLAGDQLLMSIARIIQSSLRKSDLCFRYGGDEFAALCPETSSQAMASAMQRLETQLSAQKQPTVPAVTISYGIATFPDDADDEQELIKLADEKLYVCKRRSG